jgi:molybdopterin biosynthesis enzyme
MRARLSREEGAIVARPVSSQASGSIPSMAGADALLVIPKEAEGLAAGEEVDAIALGADV